MRKLTRCWKTGRRSSSSSSGLSVPDCFVVISVGCEPKQGFVHTSHSRSIHPHILQARASRLPLPVAYCVFICCMLLVFKHLLF